MDGEQQNPVEPAEHHEHHEQAQPEPEKPAQKKPWHGSPIKRFKGWYGSHKLWTIPLTIFLLIAVITLVPWTRYKVYGLFVKHDFTVQVLDSETNTPVSGADVSMQLKTVETDGSGKAILRDMKIGPHSMLIHKAYYKDDMRDATVPLIKQKNPLVIKLMATGRQAKVTVTNTITKALLANVTIKAAGATFKTGKDGTATVVVPVGASSPQFVVTPPAAVI